MNEPTANTPRPEKGRKALIYVVDDEPMLLELASVILQPLGHQIRTFRDPKQALTSFEDSAQPPDLIITDYAMHAMNGRALLSACRRIRPGQKFLLVSGTVDETVYRDGSEKPNRFLAKPYQPKQLVEAVHAMLK